MGARELHFFQIKAIVALAVLRDLEIYDDFNLINQAEAFDDGNEFCPVASPAS